MGKYIDKEKAIKSLWDEVNFYEEDTEYDIASSLSRAINVVEKTQEADVAPVVRAKWKIDLDDQGWLSHKCTNCGYTKRTDVHVSLDWKYCPNCGAKMER